MLRPPIFAISILAIAAWNFLFKQRSNHAQFKNVVKRDLYSKFAPFNCLVKSFPYVNAFVIFLNYNFLFFFAPDFDSVPNTDEIYGWYSSWWSFCTKWIFNKFTCAPAKPNQTQYCTRFNIEKKNCTINTNSICEISMSLSLPN